MKFAEKKVAEEMVSKRYPEITASGSPYEIGQQIGEAARDKIRGFSAIALDRVNKTINISPEKALAIARASAESAEQYAPHLLEELRGMSAASGVSLDDLMILQVRNQFTSESDSGCTSFAVHARSCAQGHTIVAQNWDNDPELDKFTVVLTRRPIDKPALMNVTQAGLIAYIGFNNEGIGACVNTLPAPSRPVGVPHYFILRTIYEKCCLEDALETVQHAERAIPANIILSTPQGPANLEITMNAVHVLRDEKLVTHTNHCLHPELVEINDHFPELIESGPRKSRIDSLLGTENSTIAIDHMKMALRDHSGYPQSICRHPNDHPETGFWTTVFSVIIDPVAGEMHLTRGVPCKQPYEIYRMT